MFYRFACLKCSNHFEQLEQLEHLERYKNG